METSLVDLRAQLRRLRQLSHDDLNTMLTRMRSECQALVSTVQNMQVDPNEPVDLAQVQTVAGTLGNLIEALVVCTLSGTFREFGGPEEMLDELMASGRQPTAEELDEIARAISAVTQ